jgi:phosphatidylinositol-3-phosphatase
MMGSSCIPSERIVMSIKAVRMLAVLAAGVAVGLGAVGATSASAASCGTLALSSTKYTHVVWIWMENHSYSEIIGSPQAPYINGLAGECGLATNYHNISHGGGARHLGRG